MTEKSNLRFNRPSLFSPNEIKSSVNLSGPSIKKSFADVAETNISNSSSFRYDPPGTGIKNSQQLLVDWSKFENHTFFESAQAKVNVAFDKIINEYPFDGTKKQIESYLDSLTGFDKWVFDKFPRNRGFLLFSGTQTTEVSPTLGTYVVVPDFVGSKYPTISKNTSGKSILDPEYKSFAIELQLFLPEISNENQIVAQKLSGSNQGFTLAVSQSASTTSCDLLFGVVSSSLALSASVPVTKGKFNHVCVEFNRNSNINKLNLFVNNSLVMTSSNIGEIGIIDFTTSDFVIGSGSTMALVGGIERNFIPQQTLSGAIDEFRFWHSTRTLQQQQLYAEKSVFASPELKLYFKFNEPTGSIGPDDVVLDSSGNALHAKISNFVHSLRNTGSLTLPMIYEKLEFAPVLFPAYSDVRSLNSDLLFSASLYDDANPNLITKLIPKHYILEGQYNEAFETEEGTLNESFSGEGVPGTGNSGSTHLMVAFLYVWAKFFDELKLFIEHFGNILFVDYNENDTSPDQFLPFVAKHFGLEIPTIFQNSEIGQFINAENIQRDIGTGTHSLQYVQNQIWRRILTNFPEIIKSKGTLYAVKALLRTLGINPDNNFRIREFGGAKEGKISNLREQKFETSTLIDFSGTIAQGNTTLDANGIPTGKPFIRSGYFSGSRLEIGFPEAQGSFVNSSPNFIHGISNNPDDGLFTSGSWTFEGIYKFPHLRSGSHISVQSLARFEVTGTSSPSNNGGVLANLIAVSGSTTGSIKFFARPTTGSSAPTLELELTGVNIFDGNKWYISCGRQRNDEINSVVSSSYFLRAGRNDFGKIAEVYATSSYFMEAQDGTFNANMFQNIETTLNASGCFVAIGSQSLATATHFLNDATNVSNNDPRATNFSGMVGHVRFWSKALNEDEYSEHIRNYKSLGVKNPLKNFNFTRNITGSFERLRLDASSDQTVTSSNSTGLLEIFDFSQNHLHFSGSGFELSQKVIKPERFDFSYLSSKFDENASFNKVRSRGFLEEKNAKEFNTAISPVYEINRREEPMDDPRFSIEFSVVHALDEDISNIFATFDEMENALGDPNLLFAPDYPQIENMRQIYFNRLEKKMNFKDLFSFFKYFDQLTAMSSLIEKLIPRKSVFFGINHVLESHMLERAKIEYHSGQQYVDNRREDKSGKDLNGTIKAKT